MKKIMYCPNCCEPIEYNSAIECNNCGYNISYIAQQYLEYEGREVDYGNEIEM